MNLPSRTEKLVLAACTVLSVSLVVCLFPGSLNARELGTTTDSSLVRTTTASMMDLGWIAERDKKFAVEIQDAENLDDFRRSMPKIIISNTLKNPNSPTTLTSINKVKTSVGTWHPTHAK